MERTQAPVQAAARSQALSFVLNIDNLSVKGQVGGEDFAHHSMVQIYEKKKSLAEKRRTLYPL